MNKLTLHILAILLLVAACRKTPDLGDLSSQFLVSTNLDKTANFGSYKTFFIPDTVAYIGGVGDDSILVGAVALQLVNTVKTNLTERSYTFTDKSNNPDLGITLAVVKTVNIDIYYPGWWGGYPGYWDPWYWGWYYPYYYPWTSVYAYTTGTIIINMIDLKNVTQKQQLTSIWNCTGIGAVGDNPAGNIDKGITAINQGFEQSPYLQTE